MASESHYSCVVRQYNFAFRKRGASAIRAGMPRRRHLEHSKFRSPIDRRTPAHFDPHPIVDHYATHRHPVVERWLRRNPRLPAHFTPASRSWLSLFKRAFRDPTDQRIRLNCRRRRHPRQSLPSADRARTWAVCARRDSRDDALRHRSARPMLMPRARRSGTIRVGFAHAGGVLTLCFGRAKRMRQGPSGRARRSL